MPVNLRTEEEWNVWLRTPSSEARDSAALPDGALQIIATLSLKYVPGLDELPEPGDLLRLPMASPSLDFQPH